MMSARQKKAGGDSRRHFAWGRICWLLMLGMTVSVRAHVGSPNVFFEGPAGAYPVRVVVRPPGVIPGLAEVSVRVFTNGVESVKAVPIRLDTGRKGAPPPDVAQRVSGESNLFSAQLWFMRGGAQSVEVMVEGSRGSGRVTIPVNAVATRVLGMPGNVGLVLSILGGLLVVLLALIVAGAVRESVLPPGEEPGRKRKGWSRAASVGTAILMGLLLWRGKVWWDLEASDYTQWRLYHPMTVSAAVEDKNGGRTLTLSLADENFQYTSPLMPDHGKLMHVFLVREPEMGVFAHLHPTRADLKTFQARLPSLPEGKYRVYADVTYETGLTDTFVTSVAIPAEPVDGGGAGGDPDDAWVLSEGAGRSGSRTRVELPGGYSMEWMRGGELKENRDERMRFVVRGVDGKAIEPEPYMGMLGHLILRNLDGSVFTHLHPSGSFSMASRQLFEMRAEGRAPLRVANAAGDPVCTLPPLSQAQEGWLRANPLDGERAVSFPYAFPKPGNYRLWVQVKVEGKILTGVFDAAVSKK